MSLFKKIFSKKDSSTKIPKGFHQLTVAKVTPLVDGTVEIQLNVPNELKDVFRFIPGQYLNFSMTIDGKEQRRSYSICSGPTEKLAVAVKQIEKGIVSSWFNSMVAEGDEILVAAPQGNFKLTTEKTIVAVAAGSGITPIMAIAKAIETNGNAHMHLLYGNRNQGTIVYKNELDQLKNTQTTHFLSQETAEGFEQGRITKDAFTTFIKSNLEILKADGFYICGPEDMIFDVKEVLNLFGVAASKIHFELFTTPTHHQEESHVVKSDFKGTSHVKVIIDSEEFEFDLDANGKTLLEKVDSEGADAPYSCRGGVCSTCKAKIISGKATMTLNYSLTDKEIEEGYVLTCQAHPASDELTVTYDF